MGPFRKYRAQCREFRGQLEDAAGVASDAKIMAELLAAVPARLREHTVACADCRAAAEHVLSSRVLLSGLSSRAAIGGEWFPTRVMAAIAARSSEQARTADTWTFLPKLAARLTWASALALLLASGWLYQKPAVDIPSTKSVATDITGEPLRDSAMPANNDEVLVSLAERPR
ncbi:MAG TPA: hypothetical protein VMI32_17420 [Candidatus Solibacter sp.]|nr:hypothetical protein [Candidatus Solibacter sp.]